MTIETTDTGTLPRTVAPSARESEACLASEVAPSTVDDYARQITAAWQKGVVTIIETGSLLIRAKDGLPHGGFGVMIREKLPFGCRTAQQLMKIAQHPVLSNARHASHLPPSWMTLYALAELPEEELEKLLADGRVNSETRRRDVQEIRRKILQQGLYLWGDLVKALRTVIKFADRYSDPNSIAERVLVGDEEEEGFDLSKLAGLPRWIERLLTAGLQVEEDGAG
jgi:hypothetical protein